MVVTPECGYARKKPRFEEPQTCLVNEFTIEPESNLIGAQDDFKIV
ncbi:MAG: hypothetical protein SFT68_03120 [Rickettsiaceae bacterium]|nr:hypothetical protein [Rickettsiaceae bacterium]